MLKSLISFLFKLAKLLSIHDIAEEDVSETSFKISNSGTDFLRKNC